MESAEGVVAVINVVEGSSTPPAVAPEVGVDPTPASHPRSMESSRKEASNTSSNSTMQASSLPSTSAGQGKGVLLPVSYSSPPGVVEVVEVRSSVAVRGEAADDDKRWWSGEGASEMMEGDEMPFVAGTDDWD